MKTPTNDITPQGFKITELGVLPEEWKVVRINDLCDITTGKKDVNEGNPKGIYPFFTCAEKITYSDSYSFDTEAILVSGNGDVGLTKYYKGKFEVYQRTYVFYNFKTNPKFLFYYFLSGLKKKLIKNKSGSTMPYIRKGDLLSFLIPLPPLLEQQKIAAVLSAVQEAKEKTEAVIAATKALKKSIMKHIFTYGPVSPQEAETVSLKETEIGPVPEDWEVVRLGEVLENKNIKFKNLENNYKDIPILSMTRELGLIRQEHKFDKRVASKDLSNYKIVEKGNVVVGFPIDEGVISILFNSDYGVVSPTYEIWQLKSKNIDLYFFDTLLRYELMMNQYLKYMTRGVERRRIIKKNDFTSLFVSLPPFPTQQKIASILSAIDAKIEAEENKKKALEELFKSLLHNLMTAKIRVNQLEISS